MALSHGISEAGLGERLFDRRCRLVVAPPLSGYAGTDPRAIVIENLRVTFRIKKTRTPKPNAATITVNGLSDDSRALMQSKGARVILQAGYDDAMGTVFFGDSERIDHKHDGPEWVTKIEAKDAGRAYLNARVAETFAGSIPRGTAMLRVAQSLGLGIKALEAHVPTINASKSHANGWTAHGRAAPELTRLLKAVGLEWSAQDGDLIVWRKGEGLPDVVVLDEDHGLLGAPEYGTSEKKGKEPLLKLRSLLRYQLRIGSKVALKSRTISGTFMVEHLEHTGDTAAGPWFSDLEVKPA